ncbi:MAG: methionyl-tRNA formyltransferase [Flavobacteriaceae bacterium]
MKDLRILFMGTPDFAVATLHKLVEAKYNIVGVITAVDKPAGRGRKLRQSAVKQYAQEVGIPVLQPTNLKDAAFLEELAELKANLQIVVAFRMLPQVVWNMPKYGTFNLHASLLPNYRGAAPINWAIINGEEETGVTTFFIDEKIDTGAIILQNKTTIEKDDTAGTLHDKLMLLGASLVLKTVERIAEGKATSTAQKIEEGTVLRLAPKIHKEDCKINWDLEIEEIYNHIRGLSPYPAAWSILVNDEESFHIKVYASKTEYAKHSNCPGLILSSKKELKVAVADGYIVLEEIQLAGKRRMPIADVLNGLKLSKTAHMA